MSIPQYVVQASPLSKLFMKAWTGKCEEDPAIVLDPKIEFEIVIPRTNGAIRLTHNKPIHISKLEPHNPQRVKDDYLVDDLDGTVLWLCGGEDGNGNEETDIYGVVGLNIDMDLSSALSDVALFDEEDSKAKEKAAKKYQDIQKALLTKTKTALQDAREKADFRVKRAMKNTHINLMKQYETLQTQGMGKYAPSVAEAVGAYVLKTEIEKSGANRRKMVEMLAATMNETTLTR